jgi:hypothetical protein
MVQLVHLVYVVLTVQAAASAQRGPPGPPGPAGPAGTTSLHALFQPACDTKCELICSPGEKLVSVTCPGGKIQIEEIAESNSASCVSASGPAFALCLRQ